RIKLGAGGQGQPRYQQAIVMGLDDATLVGAPRHIILGSLADLRQPDAVIMDENGHHYLWPDEPLRGGRGLELNDHRAVIVGICQASDPFNTFPVLYARYHQALRYVPQERRVMSAVLVGVEPGVSHQEVCRRIEERTGRQALTRQGFIWSTLSY